MKRMGNQQGIIQNICVAEENLRWERYLGEKKSGFVFWHRQNVRFLNKKLEKNTDQLPVVGKRGIINVIDSNFGGAH